MGASNSAPEPPTLAEKGWSGPGVILALSPSENGVLIAMKGYVPKVVIEEMRPAMGEEWLGNEVAREMARGTLESLRGPNQCDYIDVIAGEMPCKATGPNQPDEVDAPIQEASGPEGRRERIRHVKDRGPHHAGPGERGPDRDGAKRSRRTSFSGRPAPWAHRRPRGGHTTGQSTASVSSRGGGEGGGEG